MTAGLAPEHCIAAHSELVAAAQEAAAAAGFAAAAGAGAQISAVVIAAAAVAMLTAVSVSLAVAAASLVAAAAAAAAAEDLAASVTLNHKTAARVLVAFVTIQVTFAAQLMHTEAHFASAVGLTSQQAPYPAAEVSHTETGTEAVAAAVRHS